MNRPKTTWVSQVISKERGLYYVQFKPFDGRPAYYFISVKPEREPAFRDALDNAPSFDLADFGDIITSGFGEEAPDHVRQWVQQWHQATA